jgi:hypothetical protein
MRNGFWILWLVLALGVTGVLWVGGQPDPRGLGQALDGAWRFHPGDNPAWAETGADDRNWDRLALVSDPSLHDGDVGIPGYFDGWRARGHHQVEGYGWYRRQVILPQHGDLVLAGPPVVDDGYEMFWDGQPIGGIGTLSGSPKVGVTRPLLVKLPPSDGKSTALLAIRTFMQPHTDRDGLSGGLRTVPVLASPAQGQRLHQAQWRRTIAGYVVDAVEPVLMLLLVVMAAFVARVPDRREFALWIGLALMASAGLRLGNAVTAWSDMVSLPRLLWQNGVILAPVAKLGWTLAWNAWVDGKDRRFVSFIAVAAWIALVAGAVVESPLLAAAGRALIALSLALIAIRIARFGRHKSAVLSAMALTSVGLFAPDLSAMGVPSIWFPFNIGVSRSQYAYALTLPVLAYVLAAAGKRDDSVEGRATWKVGEIPSLRAPG